MQRAILMLLGAICLAAFLVTSCCAADANFEGAITRIESTLVNPPADFGLEIIDVYELHHGARIRQNTEGFAIYAAGGKLHYRHDTYDADESLGDPYWQHFVVLPSEGASPEVADISKKAKTLTRNESVAFARIGEVDTYFAYFEPAKRKESPTKSPVQILLNPCLAPLKITPLQLTHLDVNRLADLDGLSVYETEWIANDERYSLIMHFSTAHASALAMTDYRVSRNEGAPNEGATSYHTREVRKVTQWQQIQNGDWAPAEYTMERDYSGKVDVKLTRRVTEALIGDVPSRLFDTSQLSEFQVKWDRIVDANAPENDVILPGAKEKRSLLWIGVNLAVVLLLILLVAWRGFSRRAGL
jgi:hypothetical protein